MCNKKSHFLYFSRRASAVLFAVFKGTLRPFPLLFRKRLYYIITY